MWCLRPLVLVFRRQRQLDFYGIEASLVYIVSSRLARDAFKKKMKERETEEKRMVPSK